MRQKKEKEAKLYNLFHLNSCAFNITFHCYMYLFSVKNKLQTNKRELSETTETTLQFLKRRR